MQLLDDFGARVALFDELANARKPDGHQREFRGGEKGVHADQENDAEDVERAHRLNSLTAQDSPCKAILTRGARQREKSREGVAVAASAARLFPDADAIVVIGGLAARYGQRRPAIGREMFRDKDDLADVIGVVRDLSVDRLHHGMTLAANADRCGPCRRRSVAPVPRKQGSKPPPTGDNFGTSLRGIFELRVTIATGLFTVGSEEIRPTRAHVAGEVLYDDGDRIGLGIERRRQAIVRDLRHGLFAEALVVAQEGRWSLPGRKW